MRRISLMYIMAPEHDAQQYSELIAPLIGASIISTQQT